MGFADVDTGDDVTGDRIQMVVPVYNVIPAPGAAASFAFSPLVQIGVRLDASVSPSGGYRIKVVTHDLSEAALIRRIKVTFWGVPADHQGPDANEPPGGWGSIPDAPTGTIMEIVEAPTGASLRSFGSPSDAVRRPFMTNPTVCGRHSLGSSLRFTSWQTPTVWTPTLVAPFPDMTGCDRLSFAPALSADPSTAVAGAPAGYDVDVVVPQADTPDGVATSPLRSATVTLPLGTAISPAAAAGLEACTDEAFDVTGDAASTCPDSAKIGSVQIDTPLLEEPVDGSVYLGTQQSDDPESGKMYRLFLVADGPGVRIKLPGSISADPRTGQLTTTFVNAPEMPFSRLRLRFKGGDRAPLANPQTCGSFNTTSALTAWSGRAVNASSSMDITQDCGTAQQFSPTFSAGTVNPRAGSSSPFVLRVAKPDRQADLAGLSMVLPEGLLAHLKGNLGTRVGTARVAAGPGASPFWLSGPVALEGAYGDAPFSLRVTIPAVAGPFYLGDVVVRQKIYIDSHDAHVTIVSDPLPTIVKGVPVRLQNLAVDIDKAGFMKNPTSCAPKTINATLGAATGQTAPGSSRFQVGDCANLPLNPKLKMDLVGKKETKRGQHPKLSATMTQKAGESGLRKVKIRLPLSLALDPDNAQALCKPEQAAAKACPAGSIVGEATAVTPLLDRPLSGNVYFVEGTRKTKEGRIAKTLPKLWVALRGQVALDVWADSAIGKGQALETTFGFVPDAPISSFKIDIDGGAHGILAVTGAMGASLCKQALTSRADYDGQTGKHVTKTVRMGSPCGFQVAKKSLTNTHAKITVAGIGAGKLTITGKGIRKLSRNVKSASVATIQPRLTTAGMRTAKRGKALRLRVSFNPKGKGKTRHATTVVKRAKSR